MNKKTIITILLALVALAGQGQTTKTAESLNVAIATAITCAEFRRR
jgi:tRNA G18 (ribose-2'-O)-methylase SpoU